MHKGFGVSWQTVWFSVPTQELAPVSKIQHTMAPRKRSARTEAVLEEEHNAQRTLQSRKKTDAVQELARQDACVNASASLDHLQPEQPEGSVGSCEGDHLPRLGNVGNSPHVATASSADTPAGFYPEPSLRTRRSWNISERDRLEILLSGRPLHGAAADEAAEALLALAEGTL